MLFTGIACTNIIYHIFKACPVGFASSGVKVAKILLFLKHMDRRERIECDKQRDDRQCFTFIKCPSSIPIKALPGRWNTHQIAHCMR